MFITACWFIVNYAVSEYDRMVITCQHAQKGDVVWRDAVHEFVRGGAIMPSDTIMPMMPMRIIMCYTHDKCYIIWAARHLLLITYG